MNWLLVVKKKRPPESRSMMVDLWFANAKWARNRLVGDYSREVGQHPVTARHANLTYNAQPFLVTYGVSSALSRRFADNPSNWITSEWPTIPPESSLWTGR